MKFKTCFPNPAFISQLLFVIAPSFFIVESVFAQQAGIAPESKVDYLERVYFSGQNKAGLNTQILIVLQEFQDKTQTPALIKQTAFLSEIQKKIPQAEDACEVLDMIAVGIYNLDAAEALKQGVKSPSDKAKVKTFDALSSISRLQSASSNIGMSARGLEQTTYATNGGQRTDVASSAGKVANTANTVGNVANAAQQAGQTAKQLGDVGKSLGIGTKKKDKPCNEVPKKDIAPGVHQAQATNVAVKAAAATTITTVINVQGITSAALKSFTESLRSKAGVKSAEKSFNEQASTITVVHEGSTDVLADWIEENFGSQLKTVNYSSGQISLAAKMKK